MKVTGYVAAGDTKQTLPFANIVPVDASGNIVFGKGTTTNVNGEYSIDVEPGQKLRFSYVGYDVKIISPDDADMVTLKPTATKLNEVVITAKRPVKKKDNTLIYAAAAALIIVGAAAATRD